MHHYSDGKLSSTASVLEAMSAKGNQVSTSAGTFMLRRAQYFSGTERPTSNLEEHQDQQCLSMEPIPLNKVED